MPDLTMGANAPIIVGRGDLVLEWPSAAGSLDCSAFLLSSKGKVRSDDDMIFFNQRDGAGGSVRLVSPDGGAFARFAFDLENLPADVERIVVCAVVDGDRRTMESFAGLEASFGSGPSVIRFRPDLRGAEEAALRVVEIYRRGDGWKLRADGQGYNAGLGALAESFGVEVEGSVSETAEPSVPDYPDPGGSFKDSPGAGGPQDERSIVFDVQPVDVAAVHRSVPRPGGASVLEPGRARTLSFPSGQSEYALSAVLSWSSREGGSEGRARALRLRLGAFYETRVGLRGAVQDPDARSGPPGDDLVTLASLDGADMGRQTVFVAPGRLSEVGVLQLYAVLDGPSTWRSSSVELLVTVPGNQPVAIEVPEQDDGCSCVLIASVRIDADGANLQHVGRAAADQQALDAEMGWNLRWRHADPT